MIRKTFYNWWYKKHPPEMVDYWKTKESIRAKVTESEDRSYVMELVGEKYPFPGFPRSPVLMGNDDDPVLEGGNRGYSVFCQAKHIVKNFIFNDSWELLEKGEDLKAIERIKNEGLDKIVELAVANRYLMLPIERCSPAVKEIYRGMTEAIEGLEGKRKHQVEKLRDLMCMILQEDDSYRFRVQWLVQLFPGLFKRNLIRLFEKSLIALEHAEITDDMKGKIRLLRRVLLLILKDKTIYNLFEKFVKATNWSKVKLTKADKYYFRGKWFKVDNLYYDY